MPDNNNASGQGSTLNAKVKATVDGLVGQNVVGSGECYDLADKALKDAGAKSAPDYGKITPTADYKWGSQVADLKLVQAGDVLQFRNHEVEVRTDTKTKETYADGSWSESSAWQTSTENRGHHTAVVSTNDGNGTLSIVEQNVVDPSTKQKSKVVRKNTLIVSGGTTTKTEVTTRKDPAKGQVKVETTTTVTIKVKGTVWAYRPTK